MSEEHCGGCDYHILVRQGLFECRIDGERHERGYHCKHFKTHDPRKSSEDRQTDVIGKRREIEAQKDREHAIELAQTRMTFDKKLWRASWWWQLILVVIGAVLGFIGTIIFKP